MFSHVQELLPLVRYNYELLNTLCIYQVLQWKLTLIINQITFLEKNNPKISCQVIEKLEIAANIKCNLEKTIKMTKDDFSLIVVGF